MPTRNILVTGASGFVGANLLLALEKFSDVFTVHAWTYANEYPSRLSANASRVWHRVDITQDHQVREALQLIRPEIIVHAAAAGVDFRFQEIDADRMFRTNVLAPLNLITMARERGLRRFIHLGSCLEYGNVKAPATESLVPDPLTIYGSSKAASSLMLRERGKSLGIETCVFRLFGMWGAFEHPNRLFPQVVKACRTGSPLSLSRGDQKRDYSYVGDICETIAQVASGAVSFPRDQILNLGSGRASTVRDIVCTWARAFGREELMNFGSLSYREQESLDLVADISAASWLGIRIVSRPVVKALEEVVRLENLGLPIHG